jgi:carbon-monoxide dehydrogenase iron sulfur subunit
MIICDVQQCVGCRMCEVACSISHFGAVSPALSRIRVAKLEEIGIDVAIACVGCVEKPCLECSEDALTVGSSGQIVLDGSLCIGCEECAIRCPIGSVGYYRDEPLFCDLCDGAPSCVEVCPTDALVNDTASTPSLAPYMSSEGPAVQRRVRYAGVVSQEVRDRWLAGWRLGE